MEQDDSFEIALIERIQNNMSTTSPKDRED